MGVEVAQAAALATSTFAAIAAGASWANVLQTRKSLKTSVLPDLHVAGVRVEPSGPIYGLASGVTSLQFNIYNAGGGIAKGVGYVLWHGTEYVIGFVAPMLRPGETYRIKTDMTPTGSDGEWGGIVTCFDLHNHRRTWKLHSTKATVSKREDESTTLPDIYRQVRGAPDLAALTRRKAKAELVPA
jgi:hypothetical protein